MVLLNLYILLLSLLSPTAADNPSYLYHVCPNTTTFTRNSTYHSNLNNLLSTLSSNSTRGNGFFNASAGQDHDDVYGLFLCRCDVSTEVCRDCVTYATEDIVQRCPLAKVAIVWYDECLLRYSNRFIFSAVNTDPEVYLWNTVNTSEIFFDNLVLETMISAAANASSGAKKCAVAQNGISILQRLYTFLQCTPDLSVPDCNKCLIGLISQLTTCCSGKRGGRILLPSCNIRYESYPFYNSTALSSPVARPPPPASGPLMDPAGNYIPTEPKAAITPGNKKKNNKSTTIVAVIVPTISSMLLITICITILLRKRNQNLELEEAMDDITTVESLQFDFKTIKLATSNFSEANKLGQGGFGAVYKGTLPDGQEIAVKRLSRSSQQGAEQFKNEAVLVAKLQHRHLVRLLGFCLEGEEKILVYEFLPNKSLNYFLFDYQTKGQLDWSARYKIIGGIARGILYLHEDSRLKIIHRDLKASNILLDENMNPKISDFGMARIFGVDQTEESSNRIVGTYGYMAPEYAMRGMFSVKSDAYSFGILILEIVSGKKISSLFQSDGGENLVSYVWKHWNEGTPLEVLDPSLTETYSTNEVVRCIHIGLLCIQEDPADRPTMTTVVFMLSSYYVPLPSPKQPSLFLYNITELSIPNHQSTNKSVTCSVNEMSITEACPR